MLDDVLLRYSRQIMLPEIGIEGQQSLTAARALIVGLGGLGSPAAMYLAAAGVGTLQLVDDDHVDLSNLQRQIMHTTESVGQTKAASAKQTLEGLNPEVRIEPVDHRLDPDALDRAVRQASVVLDCSDNFATRFAINRACRRHARPLVSGAAIRWDGQIAVFDGKQGSPCYRCLYGEDGNDDLRCSTNGVISPLVGIIGSMQALEAIKLICASGDTLNGRLLVLDALRMSWRELRLRADPACPVCSN
jgi:adenylyltransferase/sulfurtransferase